MLHQSATAPELLTNFPEVKFHSLGIELFAAGISQLGVLRDQPRFKTGRELFHVSIHGPEKPILRYSYSG